MNKKISDDEITLLAKYIYDVSGISIDRTKSYLLETRLGSLLEEYGLDSYRALHQKAKTDLGKSVETKIIDAISTNETLFFRDGDTFEVFRNKIVPDLIDARSARTSPLMPVPIRIWSAACSTGQEIISIAITLKELLGDMKKYRIKLLGTDISDAAVSRASYGIYSKFEIDRGMSIPRLQKYFTPTGANWKINDEIRSMATFQRINLLNPFGAIGKFDIVFCRNVAIYFNPEDRKRLFDRIADILEPDGVLVIGATESLTGVCPRFEPKRHIRSIYYQLKGGK
jgi:chemotaxis protein methyltransferase CheR